MKKTALITGAAKRLGKELVLHLAAEGWNIAIHYHKSKDDAFSLYKLLKETYPNQEFDLFQANLANPLAAEELIPKIIQTMPRLSLLINNASTFEQSSLLNSPFDLIEQSTQINYIAPLILSRDFARHAESGNIINLSDTRVTANKSDYAVYTLAKKALWELTKMSALEFAPNFRVNSLALGTIIPRSSQGNDYLDKLTKKLPLHETASVKSVLKTVDFILANKHITGQQIFCDGGSQLGKPHIYRD